MLAVFAPWQMISPGCTALRTTASYSMRSGSGSAVFGLFDDAQKAGNLRLQTPFVYTL